MMLTIRMTLLLVAAAYQYANATAEAVEREDVHLRVQLGHRNQERVSFASRELDGSRVFVVSYFRNGRPLNERVVPEEFMKQQVADFEKALPRNTRKALVTISSCGEPLTVVQAPEQQTDLVCLDLASRVDRALLARWLRSLRQVLGIPG